MNTNNSTEFFKVGQVVEAARKSAAIVQGHKYRVAVVHPDGKVQVEGRSFSYGAAVFKAA